ncbi:MAG TPA: glucose 1-dehydrogenase [Acidimicrobiales bacterium]|nr:glucose 1-dehydrogenase [Acidimicrobiales bacterium]
MTNALQGKVAVITGGSSGIGLAIAKRFVSEGAHVYITGRRQAELDAAVTAIGAGVTSVRSDVANLRDLDTLYETIDKESGRIDVLVANAGGGSGSAPLGDITEEQFNSAFNVNVKGVLFTVQKALPLMGEGSSVILTGSTTSIKGGANMSVYSATKAAVRNFARSWILDLQGRNIRVNVLSPGPTETPGLLRLAPPEYQQHLLDKFASLVPLGRVGNPDEIAKAAVFLGSDASSFVNGAELFVDGGQAQI